ncbi:MAG: glycosyltransferase [Blastocatellia bacterium]
MGTARKTILLFHGALRAIGGAEAVAAWTIEALRDDYDITVLTWEADAPDKLNHMFGASLRAGDYRIIGPSRVARMCLDHLVARNERHRFQKVCWLYRLARRMRNDYDLLISTHDEVDFGRAAIQYIHYPTFHRILTAEREAAARAREQTAPVRALSDIRRRLQPWRLLSGFSSAGIKMNLTLANSHWTGAVVRDLYGVEAVTVYPPVAGDFPDVPWEQRANQFVCIGRFVPHKRLDLVIDTLAAVRGHGHDVRLLLIGLPWDDAAGRDYLARIRARAAEHAAWITIAENIPRAELVRRLGASRYGIHAAEEEPFGIAPAEMAQAGCIPFTGYNGGQAEIVGRDERLLFETVEEGARKIMAVLENPDAQIALRQFLGARKSLFSADTFVRRIREIVQTFAAAPGG